MKADNFLLMLFVHVCQGTIPYRRREWRTLYMDEADRCQALTVNDDMAEGDVYIIESDRWYEAREHNWRRHPAECTQGFNLEDRLVSINVLDWRCDEAMKDPFLAIYDDCNLQRVGLLAKLNCSSTIPTQAINSSGSCTTIYHYRGHTRKGYFFKLEIMANEEIIAFPAGGIAAIIIASIVVLMILVKIVCVITGYDSRLPDIDLDGDEYKQILDNASEPIVHVNESDYPGVSSPSRPSQTMVLSSAGRQGGHTVLTVSRSAGSAGHASTSAELSSDYEYDFLDDPTTPRLKRIPSGRATNIWNKQCH